MKSISKVSMFFLFTLTLATVQFWGTKAEAEPAFFTSDCAGCHGAPTVATCNGCHHHGNSSLKAATNKASYTPGETVTATLSGGTRTGWIRATLYDQNNTQLAVSSGNASGMGSSTTFPAALTAPAPTTAGTYTWKMGYYGNNDGAGHSEVIVNANSFTVVAAADTTVPVVGTFTIPATSGSLTVTVSVSASDNTAVTGYLLTESATAPAANAAGWSATAPAGYTFATAGSKVLYAWAKDAAGNVSISKSAGVTVTLPDAADTTKPTLTVSAIANGAYTNKITLNVSGNASDAGGIQSVTVNGQTITVNQDGSFSTALNLTVGANTIAIIATDKAGNQTINSRTVTYDINAPVLTVAAPADNSTTVQSFVTVNGTINETSTVTVTANNGTPQSATLNGTGFSATVNLAPGSNTIDIIATDLAGNTTSAKRTVTSDTISNLALAVTYPVQDITTSNSTLILKGKVTGITNTTTVRIIMDGKTYAPKVYYGAFRQQLTFTTAKLYAITVTATDASGNSSTVSRNVIYRPAKDDGHRDDDRDDDRKDDRED